MRRNWTPSIVPTGHDQTVYLVVDDFGRLGTAYRETDVMRVDLESVISDLMTGRYNDPVRIVAFNIAECWAEDASEDIAREILRRVELFGDPLPSSILGALSRAAHPRDDPRPARPQSFKRSVPRSPRARPRSLETSCSRKLACSGSCLRKASAKASRNSRRPTSFFFAREVEDYLRAQDA